ncbi:malto-oligosyltrehalose synthase [Rhizobium sp. 32-5/1]|uniref:malto-oligosyltrehalose synthase n=1 Tax=Rhizobium sp. 32-5/1 TaxID=3019602 RepID=UPI00240D7740|nr:malto-oligosyltrehalose synthase [Rhizobium sp. 32-5/1]WEZ82106.1 malto-oligosyltrehalose synthase [Rhizobium sp. 32-5/1]
MIPSATYRLQFRNGVTFDTAIELIEKLRGLGISHLYASPIFTATEGSTHGYDIIDVNEIDPAIGGRGGFSRLSDALRKADIGLILDIVPNHMAASVENAWWTDVLQKGKTSPFANHFDIDWSEKITLPILGAPLETVIADGDLKISGSLADGSLALDYSGLRLPLRAESVQKGSEEVGAFDAAAAKSPGEQFAIRRLLDEQHWQLIPWRNAPSHLSYRRFFEVTGLVGVRMEDEAVFQDCHRLILELVKSGQVQGLRIDHVDGLANPSGYLDRLRAAVGDGTYIVVEKILGPDEELPRHWPVSGTTGYEFIAALSQLFVEESGLKKLDAAYTGIDPTAADYKTALREAKQLMVTRNFEGEVRKLSELCRSVDEGFGQEIIQNAIQELLIAFDVYRTYGFRGPLNDRDRNILTGALDRARPKVQDNDALNLVEDILLGNITGDPAAEFQVRFQQLSGPVMAKSLEDTVFYRYNRFLATNEVGGSPNEACGSIEAFHATMSKRLESQANGLSATATHDTKRGEDARARLYAISEGAPLWVEGVKRWNRMNKSARSHLSDGVAPELNIEWMLYQSLAGIWPERMTECDCSDLQERFVRYTEKAFREAKLRTNWANPNEAYEKAVMAFAANLLSAESMQFREDFGATLRPFIRCGFLNSMSQTLIKLTAPGVPDFYQGTDGPDFSLVDPDNRHPLNSNCARCDEDTPSPERLKFEHRKRKIIRHGLAFRNENKTLFDLGDYLPIPVVGRRRENVVAFARVFESRYCVTIVPRLVFGHIDEKNERIPSGFWEDTRLEIPLVMRGLALDVISGQAGIESSHGLLANLLALDDVALISGTALRR